MEGEQGLSSSSETKLLTFAELVDELCPVYMSMGVSYYEYWHGDYTQLAFYRKAYELRREQSNYDAYLQGAYFYDALCMVSPMLHAFAKNGTKPVPYHNKPYEMVEQTNETKPVKTEKEIQEIQALNASAKFASYMTQWNKQFESKGGEQNGGND